MKEINEAIEKGFKALSNEEIETGHYLRTVAAARTEIARKNPVNKLVRSSALIGGLMVAAVVAMVLIPATYDLQVGSMVKAEFVLPEGLSPREVAEATSELSAGKKMLMVDNGKAYLTFASREKESAGLAQKLQSILHAKYPNLTELSVSAEPIIEKHGGNALAAVTGGRIEIGCEGLSDAEIESAITSALSAQGLNVTEVKVSTTSPAEGMIERRVEIKAEHNGNGDYNWEGSLPELELHDGGVGGKEGHQERVIVRETK